ncbi:UDP-4-amino-4-deoxy-L-arabinose--oxoglutarate aminotransferase [Nitrincola lacisaponensis]|uniref:UDP-4-amino-4-deoxy-L-arabinose--oxoglutarate aminotransferase n=1 Tax=Nitrincola lacisaponensis TaxID=267850 RepID=A0A063Y484_9GAMM|nr:DegT/DnrJ/EryC1/StrS family aminotransferase [Nitrincola lacisaponensis]KDE40454.1 UDP-4-amino-4-deoxy-L-arabinose--oxoglutarate aminotransferase [Nitrincola lacisaponensis]
MIPVTQPYLPERSRLDKYIDGIYERCWLTNNGPLVQELTQRLEAYLGVENLLLVGNGTLALQIAFRTLGIQRPVGKRSAEAITTPFTYIATASAIKWEGIEPVFADIDANTWCIDPERIREKISSRTRALVPVHVFGNSCDVESINKIARQHRLKVIYDASHAFGVKLGKQSLLSLGDASTLSFHATKLFHSIEGGAIIFKRKRDLKKARKLINFGITGPEQIEALGINAKMTEFQAAMGLSVLDEITQNLNGKERVYKTYENLLKAGYYAASVTFQKQHTDIRENHAYVPVLFNDEDTCLKVKAILHQNGYQARRYFNPSLDTLRILTKRKHKCRVSRDISSRILCLPTYATFEDLHIASIARLIRDLSKTTNSIERQSLSGITKAL